MYLVGLAGLEPASWQFTYGNQVFMWFMCPVGFATHSLKDKRRNFCLVLELGLAKEVTGMELLGRLSTLSWAVATVWHVMTMTYHALNQINGFNYAHHITYFAPWGQTP